MHARRCRQPWWVEFAGQYDRFWKAHDWLYSHQATLGPPLYGRLLQMLQLNAEELGPAMAGGHLEARIRADIDGGERSGVDGTPAFLNGEAIHIQHSHDELYELVLRALR
jgi:protein-disulfide isomerase